MHYSATLFTVQFSFLTHLHPVMWRLLHDIREMKGNRRAVFTPCPGTRIRLTASSSCVHSGMVNSFVGSVNAHIGCQIAQYCSVVSSSTSWSSPGADQQNRRWASAISKIVHHNVQRRSKKKIMWKIKSMYSVNLHNRACYFSRHLHCTSYSLNVSINKCFTHLYCIHKIIPPHQLHLSLWLPLFKKRNDPQYHRNAYCDMIYHNIEISQTSNTPSQK